MAELSFEVQLEQVRTGQSDEIRITKQTIDARQLAQLGQLANLRSLVLDAGSVGDADVECLLHLPKLEHMRLRESSLSDAAIVRLAQGEFASLQILNLPQARPTAVALKALGQLPQLRQLRIAGRQIDDAAIAELKAWPSLSSLHLIQPGITDQSLITLAEMPELASLYIDECPLSDSAWEQFFKHRPKLHVHIDQAHHDLDPNAQHH